jgi:hypothetical protein
MKIRKKGKPTSEKKNIGFVNESREPLICKKLQNKNQVKYYSSVLKFRTSDDCTANFVGMTVIVSGSLYK